MKQQPKAKFLIESSWEVCNKVGGIYTVVKSKVSNTQQHYDNYLLVGPYVEAMAARDFTPAKEIPPWIKKAFSKLSVNCHYGNWDVTGKPQVILVDFSSLLAEQNELKKRYWDWAKIDSLSAGSDFTDPLCWSYAVGQLVEALVQESPFKPIVAHFHEWLAGLSIIYLKHAKVRVGTVFTTHATMLGRALCGTGYDLYENLTSVNPDDQAYKLHIQEKFTAERAIAQAADQFTTVSETTAMEAEHLLGRKPDVILTNGLDLSNFPTLEENSLRHIYSRDKIREFIAYYFFPHYSFDLTHNLTFFILGRYEYRNKGIDFFIEALAGLEAELQKQKTKRTITAVFWIPMAHNGVNISMLENKDYYRHIQHYVNWKSDDILTKLIHCYISGENVDFKNVFDGEFLADLKKDVYKFKRTGDPPLSTHNLADQNDAIVTTLRNYGLTNTKSNKVKVILYPIYLDGNDGLLNLSYYEAIAGCHLGVFPSYYEPFGYTPLESAAMGVPSITTDLSGFGRFMGPNLKQDIYDGMWVVPRHKQDRQEAIKAMTQLFVEYSSLSKHQRAQLKVNAQRLAQSCDWNNLIFNYIQAHNQSIGGS